MHVREVWSRILLWLTYLRPICSLSKETSMKMIWVKQGLRMHSIKFYWNQWCRDGLPWSYNQEIKPCKLEEEKVETYFCGAFLENLVLIQNLYNLQTRIICSTRPWPGHPVEGKTSKAKVSYTNAYWPDLKHFWHIKSDS